MHNTKEIIALSVAHNISNELANYMLLALDSTTRQHADFMSLSFPEGQHLQRLQDLDQQLKEVMRNSGVEDLLELYYLVADK